MKKILLALLVLGSMTGLSFLALHKKSAESTPLARLKETRASARKASVDHSRFPQLKGPFDSPQTVTAACIACHNGRDAEVMRSSHWNWQRTEYVEGQGIRKVGKKNILNNFCIGVSGSQRSCDKCHVGYGWEDDTFDLGDARNVDCLACHDNTGTFTKAPGKAGLPDAKVDLVNVAQHVGRPQRTNCGTCHFFSGGGNNVKHGDLESALFDTTKAVDVHMGADGSDMTCVECHTAEQHQMKGKLYSVSSMNRNRVECETCHTEMPHTDDVLNKHLFKVACQTCHIPSYAKVNPTKLNWDWSTAGKLKDGKPYHEEDASGSDVYMSIKGSFTWGKNLKPDYVWFNGTASHYLIGDTFDPTKPLVMNKLHGNYDDIDSKIHPVKIHRARQIYDTQHNYLIQPKLFSSHPGDGGYWSEFDWQRAAEEGMKDIDLPYSGRYGFADTVMYWPVNHMVSPKSETVRCNECHTRENGRLASLAGFYIPGRDRNRAIDLAGMGTIGLTLLGIAFHGGARIAVNRKNK